MSRKWRPRGLAAALLLSACATQVTSQDPAATEASLPATLARPNRVLVADFAVDPGAVVQDQGVGPRLERSFSGDDPSAAKADIAADVQSSMSAALISSLDGAGLPASASAAGAAYEPGDVLIEGRIERIDQGNRTRRLAIGFGAGKSIITADAQLYYVMPDGQPRLLQTYTGKSDSGRKPGMAAGAAGALGGAGEGAGVLSAAAGISAEAQPSPEAKEGARYGHRLAHNIGVFAARQGWISTASIPPWQR